MEEIKLLNQKVLRIIQDENPNDPREDDNLTKMVCFHNRYDLGDKHNYNKDDYNSWDELKKTIEDTEKPVVILPLYLYDHSGITISTTEFTCKWDSGQIGFVYITNERINELGCVIENEETINDYIKRLTRDLQEEVKQYDQFLQGDVYGFELIGPDGEEIDSCWGFYGSNWKTNGITDYIRKEDLPDNL